MSDRFISLIPGDSGVNFVRARNQARCVPLTDSGMVIFIVEYSAVTGEELLVLPGGVIEDDEPHQQTANRNLMQKIGYRAQHMNYLGELRPWAKYVDASVHLYLARDLTPSDIISTEVGTHLVPLADFERLIGYGRLTDSTVVAALYLSRQFLKIG